MTRAKDISKILTDANISGTLDVSGAFTSQGIDDNADATAITITSAELVGIGTSSPNSKLTSQTATSSTSAFSFANQLNNSNGSNNSIVALGFHNRADVNADGVGGAIALSGGGNGGGSGNLIFCIKDTSDIANTVAPSDEKMRIDSSGNVGIGTASPSVLLDILNSGSGDATVKIKSTTAGDPTLQFDSAAANRNAVIKFLDQGSAVGGRIQYNHSGDRIDFQAGSSSGATMSILNGKVLIGSTSSSASVDFDDLQIGSTGGTSGLTILSSGSATAGIAFADPAESVAHSLLCHHADNSMRFNVHGNTERLRINSSGDVGIGTTSITARLDVIDTGDADKQIVFGNNTTYYGSIGHNAGTGANIYTTENNGHHKFLMASTEHVRIDLNGNLLVGRTDNPSGVTDGIYVTGAYAQTASSSANMFINSEGRMMRSTSSLRYKNTINDATHGLTEVLALRPVTFKGNNDGDTIFGGLIAEEVHDVGLTEFVQYNDDNQPDALNYGNMVSLCIKAIQELKAENTALANRITTLEGV